MKQHYEQYTEEDFLVWNTLFNRQVENLQEKSCNEYLYCLSQLKEVMNADSIPDFNLLNAQLKLATGWTIEVVPGLIPVDEFFALLEKKKFSASTWLRNMEQLDYLEEPDMFHDIFGHIPLFMDQSYANFAQKMGALGVKHASNEEVLLQLQRIYWFTIEFGLIEQNGIKLYGAGILSSFGESNGIYTNKPQIIPFDLLAIIATDFCNSEIQTKYFSIPSFEVLYRSIEQYAKQIAVKA